MGLYRGIWAYILIYWGIYGYLGRRRACGKTHRTESKYWLAQLRVAGLKQRDGRGVVALLAVKLQAPGSAPKPEGYKEIKDSSLFKHADVAGKKCKHTALLADGAPAWPKLVKQLHAKKAKSNHVSHKKHEFSEGSPETDLSLACWHTVH